MTQILVGEGNGCLHTEVCRMLEDTAHDVGAAGPSSAVRHGRNMAIDAIGPYTSCGHAFKVTEHEPVVDEGRVLLLGCEDPTGLPGGWRTEPVKLEDRCGSTRPGRQIRPSVAGLLPIEMRTIGVTDSA